MYEYLCGSNVLFHLDDSMAEIDLINPETTTLGINVRKKGWRKRCLSLLQLSD